MMEILQIDTALVPYEFSVQLGVELYTFDVRYNERHDYYTVDLYHNDTLLVAGEKLMYGEPLFSDLRDERLPAPTIIPLDPSHKQDTVNAATFGKTVFLFVQSDGDNL